MMANGSPLHQERIVIIVMLFLTCFVKVIIDNVALYAFMYTFHSMDTNNKQTFIYCSNFNHKNSY